MKVCRVCARYRPDRPASVGAIAADARRESCVAMANAVRVVAGRAVHPGTSIPLRFAASYYFLLASAPRVAAVSAPPRWARPPRRRRPARRRARRWRARETARGRCRFPDGETGQRLATVGGPMPIATRLGDVGARHQAARGTRRSSARSLRSRRRCAPTTPSTVVASAVVGLTARYRPAATHRSARRCPGDAAGGAPAASASPRMPEIVRAPPQRWPTISRLGGCAAAASIEAGP